MAGSVRTGLMNTAAGAFGGAYLRQ
jgi:hypothetical protein